MRSCGGNVSEILVPAAEKNISNYCNKLVNLLPKFSNLIQIWFIYVILGGDDTTKTSFER